MIAVDYFDGQSSRRHAATLDIRDGLILLQGSFGQRSATLAQVDIGEDADHGVNTIQFADGALCEIRDGAAFAARLAAARGSASPVSRAQRRWRWALAALAGSVLVIAAGYFHALPWLAKLLAPAIPPSVAQSISAAVLKQLDSRLLTPSKLAAERQREITAKLALLAGPGQGLPPHRLLFRAGPAVSPNAFALPGGEVVVLDELLSLATRDEDVIAVVAHELGHLHHRHGMRQLIQSSVVSFAVGIYLGDVSTVVAGLTALLLESRYSREFEYEADAYAGRLLRATPISIEPLIDMLQRLEAAHAKARAATANSDLAKLLASHPDTAGRISALRAMAQP